MKISALAALVAVLSTFAGSAAQAGGASGAGGDIRSGPNAASNSQSQGHGGDVHTDSGKSGASGGDVLADARVSEAIWTPGDLGRAVLLAGNGLRLLRCGYPARSIAFMAIENPITSARAVAARAHLVLNFFHCRRPEFELL